MNELVVQMLESGKGNAIKCILGIIKLLPYSWLKSEWCSSIRTSRNAAISGDTDGAVHMSHIF